MSLMANSDLCATETARVQEDFASAYLPDFLNDAA